MFHKYFVTGLLLWVPVAVTVWLISLIISTLDLTLSLLPRAWRPHSLVGHDIPGLGVVLTVGVIFVTGLLTANFVGSKLVELAERILARIPIVRGIYSSVKQVSDTILSPSGNAFRKALLIQYPRQGAWTIAFLTGRPGGEVARHLDGDYISVYVPTTPNPTSGFFLMVPRADVVELKMSVDEALKYIISMGVVVPPLREPRPGEVPPNPQVPGVTGPLHPVPEPAPAALAHPNALADAAAVRPEL